jgi:hypothetical protein
MARGARRWRRRVAPALLLLAAACLNAREPGETTLSIDPTVAVDLKAAQAEAERKAALQRAADAAKLPGAREREALVPEILLLQREVLPRLPVISANPEGARQTWRVRSSIAPEMYAQRVIPLLLRAGFSSTTRCTGEEWSGTHGANRVSVLAEPRTVAVVLVPASSNCPQSGTR